MGGKTHGMPYLYMSFSTKEHKNQWLFCVNVLQLEAFYASTPPSSTKWIPRCVALGCRVFLGCLAVSCSVWQSFQGSCIVAVRQCLLVFWSVLQCLAVFCSDLQCRRSVSVSCSELKCLAVRSGIDWTLLLWWWRERDTRTTTHTNIPYTHRYWRGARALGDRRSPFEKIPTVSTLLDMHIFIYMYIYMCIYTYLYI